MIQKIKKTQFDRLDAAITALIIFTILFEIVK